MARSDPPPETVDRLRADIDSGTTGDKLPASDPAAAPLGTDAEAGGVPPGRPEIDLEAGSRTTLATAAPERWRGWLWAAVGVLAAPLLVVWILVGADEEEAINQKEFEGRLLAHRRILQLIVGAIADTPAGDRLRSLLRERSTLRDGQEDPARSRPPAWWVSWRRSCAGPSMASRVSLPANPLPSRRTRSDAGSACGTGPRRRGI